MTHPVRTAYGEVRDGLCAREDLERVLHDYGMDYSEERDHWGAVIEEARRGDFARVMQGRGGVNLVAPPEGNSWERWAGWVLERLTEVADDESTLAHGLPQYWEPWQLRAGRLDSPEAGLLRRALERFPAPEVLSRRDYRVVDVQEPVGVAVHGRRESHDVTEFPTTRLGVVLERTDRLRVLGVHPADPVEDPRTAGWRSRWPTLAASLGGWFSLGAFANRTPGAMQYTMLAEESDEHLERLAAEGAELLDLGDDDLHAAVRALGCYVEPSHLRLWLEWMFWRIGYFDWK